ncbi:DUF6191 domain-containing protein [Nakamurella leprariae]|uniref:Uncharacterized protein n=1 Tax=Nakamurella leprariae TaxID=2803911 RepID=A0A938YCQ8_9ACTN|nr:DUF6191 domain-containing protein [Nakamurella leprariae]MBM9465794.1 hypothetical protein [Nakamurella leprariae]
MTLGDLGALFNPGMRHELAERRSRAMRREEEGHGRDGDLRIDFESGVAVINVQQPDAEAAEPEDDDPGADGPDAAGAQDAPDDDTVEANGRATGRDA